MKWSVAAMARAEQFGWPGWVDALGSALIEFCWQGVAILLLYLALRALAGPRRPLLRLWIGHAALLALAAAPLATLWARWPTAVVAPADVAGSPMLALLDVGDAVAPWTPWLVAGWAAGVLLLAGRAATQWWQLRRICAEATPLPPAWQRRLQSLQQAFALRRPVRLLETARVAGPVLFGLLRPVVLLPAGLALRLPPRQLELLLAHELAHLRRWDPLANLLQIALETALFYHPAVHWISRKVREDREQCCDDLVSAAFGEPIDYARALLAVAEERAARPPLLLAAGGGLLLQRVERIVGQPDRQPAGSRWLPVLLGLGAVLLGMQALRDGVEGLPAPAPLVLEPAPLHLPLPLLRLALGDWKPQRPVALPPHAPQQSSAAASPPPVTSAAAAAAPAVITAPPTAAEPAHAVVGDRLPRVAEATDLPASAPPAAPAASTAAIPLHREAPLYPRDAMWLGIEGSVELEFLIDHDGRVGEVRVLQEEPAGQFAAAAETALRRWRFPAGTAAGLWQRQAFDFRLGSDGSGGRTDCRQITGTRLCRPAR
jgi:bla regulator protein blaR1